MLIIFGEKWSSFSLSKASGFDKRKKTLRELLELDKRGTAFCIKKHQDKEAA